MKRILFTLLVLSAALGIQSCSEDFAVTAPYKPVTVVYSVFDVKDTAHYVRIQKTFLDESKNAFDMAKVSDSSFYRESDLEVMVKELAGGNVVGQPLVLQRVDMNAEGYVKDSGAFFRTPNYAYKFKHPLDPSRTYRLVINNKINNTTDSAEIQLVDTAGLKPRGNSQNVRINFSETAPGKSGTVFGMFVQAGNAQYMEGAFRFRWIEKQPGTTGGRADSADFVFSRLSSPDDVKEGLLEVANTKIYAFLHTAMGDAPEGYARYMDSVDIIIYGAGPEYTNYINTLQIQSSGLSADQMKPLYTNIKGKDVFGLFSSKTTRVLKNAYISNETMQVLQNDANHRSLNIQGRVDP